ncbi:TolC family protein [Danxiaibacter flavus]|uniref:TolC family protein n=1 Tax=Danxiaibacter flavus TaxID=3049108 RepID=A0ABV3ZL98_9BACT|nr:TolC family protein [Chitinophagaceae bacterium DXS]
MIRSIIISATLLMAFINNVNGQMKDSTMQSATLQNCVQYALAKQPVVQQALLDEQITERQIKAKLADWYPQVNFAYNFQRNFQLQQSVINGQLIKFGVDNTSAGQFVLNQTIFNKDVLLAKRSAKDVRTQSQQNTVNNKISTTVAVSKAFYDVLLTTQQIDLLNDDIVRLKQSLKDATSQYKAGIVDKTDYKRATIALNNSQAQKKSAEEGLKAKYAYLKEQMGYPSDSILKLQYDTTTMEKDAFVDTLQTVTYQNRIEFQQLQTAKKLQEDNLKYYKWSYIPSVSAFAQYNYNFQSNKFSELYNQTYPSSFGGFSVAWPIFQGTKRTQQIKQAELELKRVDYDFISLKNAISSQFTQAMAGYKSSLASYNALKENLELAQDVYNTIQLQYKSGVKAYLEVITAESDLRSAEINYINALYQLLSSKLDVQQALGTIQY